MSRDRNKCEVTEIERMAGEMDRLFAEAEMRKTVTKKHTSILKAEALYTAGYRKQSDNVIKLPCKVGDTVYCVYRGTVTQGIVRLIRPFVSEQEIIFKGNLICEVDNLFIEDGTKEEVELYIVFEKPYGIERVAYLTRKEAEEALAKMKGGAE